MKFHLFEYQKVTKSETALPTNRPELRQNSLIVYLSTLMGVFKDETEHSGTTIAP